MVKLKPCPFCGGEAYLKSYFDRVYVECNACGAGTGAFGETDEAEAAWNKRVFDGKDGGIKMTIKDVSTLNHEIGVIQGIALALKNNNVTSALLDATEVMEVIVYKLMREVVGDDLMERMEDDGK